MNLLSCLNSALDNLLHKNDQLILMGEDIADPYGGAFKVTKGLSSKYPKQIISTPISEQAIAGIATGYALSGSPVIVEIMFADFMFLCMDQIINHASKYGEMFGRRLQLPVIFRTPCGAGRGYGPTHSQSIEKHFLNIPNLNVYYLSVMSNIDALYEKVLLDGVPSIIFEHKLMYSQEMISKESLDKQGLILEVFSESGVDTYSVSMVDLNLCQLTIATYGFHTTDLIKLVAELAFEYEIFINLIICTRLNNGESKALVDSVKITKNIITVEESLESITWGDGIIYNLLSSHKLDISKFKSLSSPCNVIPASRQLEVNAILNLKNVKDYIIENYS